MNIRTKIIGSLVIMILSVSCILLLSMALSANGIRRNGDALIADLNYEIEENIRQDLLDLARNISDYALTIEREIEKNMRNAVNVLYEADRLSGGTLTLDDVERIKRQTGMSDLYIGGVDGIFTLSTEPGGAGVALFDIWEGYRMLVTGESEFMTSDLSMKVETGEVFKFALVPRANGAGMLESALEAGAVEEYLQNYIDTNRGIRSMNLFDAGLLTLSENSAPGIRPTYTKGSFIPPGTTDIDPFFNGSTEVKLTFDMNYGQMYYPVFDGTRTRYVLYIDLDTSGYFAIERQIEATMANQVRQSSFLNTISLIAVLVVLLIFTIIISFIINRILRKDEEQHKTIEKQNQTIMESMNYASKIQRNLLPPDGAMANVFSDHSVIWEPRDVVGGDIYWMKRFDKGTALCVCDCTGHGTPGALLTMLVMSALESIITASNCDDTADIVWRLDQRLSAVLHVESGSGARRKIMNINDGCDLVVMFVAKDGSVQFSSGKIPVFICDGQEVRQFKGQKIFVGEGRLKEKYEVVITNIPANPDNKFYIASDGLYDQLGGDAGRQFGYKSFKQIILDNHHERQDAITGKVWSAFEEYRGGYARRDDLELVTFKP